MINAISVADIAFIMSSSTSAWLLSPLECSPQKQNGWMLHFCIWGWIMWKMYNKTIVKFSFRMISWVIMITQTSVLIIHDIILNLIQKLFIITTFSNTEKRVKIWHCRLFLMNFEVFDISRQVKPKLRKKWRYKIVNLCQLISEIPTPSCLWFLLLKLDQLWMSLRNTCAFTTRNVDINQSEWILSFAHVTRFSNFSAKPQLCVHLFSESL